MREEHWAVGSSTCLPLPLCATQVILLRNAEQKQRSKQEESEPQRRRRDARTTRL